jgi:1,2-diacylglycerol 3-alpha-glucosyltransferase
VFPGTHSVLWEQACACGIPGIFKSWEVMHHVDVGGNAMFLSEDTKDEIASKIKYLYSNTDQLNRMKTVAKEKAVAMFSYYEIAKRSIEE